MIIGVGITLVFLITGVGVTLVFIITGAIVDTDGIDFTHHGAIEVFIIIGATGMDLTMVGVVIILFIAHLSTITTTDMDMDMDIEIMPIIMEDVDIADIIETHIPEPL